MGLIDFWLQLRHSSLTDRKGSARSEFLVSLKNQTAKWYINCFTEPKCSCANSIARFIDFMVNDTETIAGHCFYMGLNFTINTREEDFIVEKASNIIASALSLEKETETAPIS